MTHLCVPSHFPHSVLGVLCFLVLCPEFPFFAGYSGFRVVSCYSYNTQQEMYATPLPRKKIGKRVEF